MLEHPVAPTEGAQRVKLADQWWDYGHTARDAEEKAAAIAHAVDWYQKALAQKGELLESTRQYVEKRLQGVVGAKSEVKEVADKEVSLLLPKGEWIDLLKLVDPDKHAINGPWRREGNDLIAEPGVDTRIMVPVAVNGSYELNWEFTRLTGSGHLGLSIPTGLGKCFLVLSHGGNGMNSIQEINGKDGNDPSHPATAHDRSFQMPNRTRHKINVKVQTEGQNVGIAVQLNDRPFLAYQGPIASLSSPVLFHPL